MTGALALLVLLVATPGVADVVEELIAHSMGVECCDDGGCCGGSGQSCPGTCLSCACCASSRAAPITAQVLPALERPRMSTVSADSDLPCASEFRTAPFRPPAA